MSYHPSILLPPLPLLISPDQVFVLRAQCTYTPCRLLFKLLAPPSLALLCNVDVSLDCFIVLLLHRKKKAGLYHWLDELSQIRGEVSGADQEGAGPQSCSAPRHPDDG